MSRVPSTNTLAVMVPDAPAGRPGWSLWDHALLVEEEEELQQQDEQRLEQQVQHKARARRQADASDDEPAALRWRRSPAASSSSSGSPASSSRSSGSNGGSRATATAAASSWHPSWQAPAALEQVAAFHPPEHSHRGGAAGVYTDIVCALEFEEHGWLLASAGVSKEVRFDHALVVGFVLAGSRGQATQTAAAARRWRPMSRRPPSVLPLSLALPVLPYMPAGARLLPGRTAAAPRGRQLCGAAALPPHARKALQPGLEPRRPRRRHGCVLQGPPGRSSVLSGSLGATVAASGCGGLAWPGRWLKPAPTPTPLHASTPPRLLPHAPCKQWPTTMAW